MQVVYKQTTEYQVESKMTNIFVGIFTTAWARLELYKLLDLLGENVLYVDTDSCVYISSANTPKPKLGDYLGQLTNEITVDHGPGSYMTEFLCGGPKNYAYTVNNGSKHCKIRGFTLNFKNSQRINFDSLKELIYNYVDRPVTINIEECKLVREKWTGKIESKNMSKTYQVVFDKRIIQDRGDRAVPYGYEWYPGKSQRSVHSESLHMVPEELLFTMSVPSINTIDDNFECQQKMRRATTIQKRYQIENLLTRTIQTLNFHFSYSINYV